MDSKVQSSSDHTVFQDWNGFGFKHIEKRDYPKILESLQRNFYVDEPIHQVLGMTEERKADLDRRVVDVLDMCEGSFYAYPLDQPDKVAAVLIIWMQEDGKRLPPYEPRSPLSLKVRKAIMLLKERYDIQAQRNLKIFPEIFIISTDSPYRGKGLATEMYRKAIAKFKAEGHPIVTSTFTNPFSRKIGERLGFKPVARVEFDECVNEDGSLIFGPEGKSHFMIETVLEL